MVCSGDNSRALTAASLLALNVCCMHAFVRACMRLQLLRASRPTSRAQPTEQNVSGTTASRSTGAARARPAAVPPPPPPPARPAAAAAAAPAPASAASAAHVQPNSGSTRAPSSSGAAGAFYDAFSGPSSSSGGGGAASNGRPAAGGGGAAGFGGSGGSSSHMPYSSSKALPPDPTKLRTVDCKYWLTGGFCVRGDDCWFKHDPVRAVRRGGVGWGGCWPVGAGSLIACMMVHVASTITHTTASPSVEPLAAPPACSRYRCRDAKASSLNGMGPPQGQQRSSSSPRWLRHRLRWPCAAAAWTPCKWALRTARDPRQA